MQQKIQKANKTPKTENRGVPGGRPHGQQVPATDPSHPVGSMRGIEARTDLTRAADFDGTVSARGLYGGNGFAAGGMAKRSAAIRAVGVSMVLVGNERTPQRKRRVQTTTVRRQPVSGPIEHTTPHPGAPRRRVGILLAGARGSV